MVKLRINGQEKASSRAHPFVRSEYGHPFVPTCRLAERRAQRQSRCRRECGGTGGAGARRP
jgi:hypothetical protein